MSESIRTDVRSRPAAERASAMSVGRRLRAWRDQHAYSLVSSLGRFFQRPFSTLLTVGVMAVAMALPLGLGLSLANLQRLSGSVRESREIGVFLRTDVTPQQAEALAAELRQRPDVAKLTIKTPAQGLAEFRQLTDLSGALELLGENPLPTVLLLQPNDDGARLADALRGRPGVELVQHDAVWRKRLAAWMQFALRLLLVIGGLLALGVILVVGNTVRLDIGARRDEIAVMQQLGATDGFIRRPFIYLGAWYGLAAGAAALGLVALAGIALRPTLASLIASYGSQLQLRGPDWQVALGVLLVAGFFGWFGAWLASGHHLRQTRPTDL